MKIVYIVKEGKFYTGWKLNTDFAFTTKKEVHEHMEKINGFKCPLADDAYAKKNTRFVNKSKEYGYDIISLKVYGVLVKEKPVVQEEVVEVEIKEKPVFLEDLSHDELKQLAKKNNVKSWHLKSKESLIEDLSSLPGGTNE